MHARSLVGFDCILVASGIQQAEVFQDAGRLGAFAGTEEVGNCDRSQKGDDRDDYHDFHEGKAPAIFIQFL